jgi:hypothetical protein
MPSQLTASSSCPDELDGDGDAERQAFQREVEAEVHQPEHDAEGNHGQVVPPGPLPQRRPGDQQQDRDRHRQPQRDGAGGPQRFDQLRRERAAELDRDHTTQHHRRRRHPQCTHKGDHITTGSGPRLVPDRWADR